MPRTLNWSAPLAWLLLILGAAAPVPAADDARTAAELAAPAFEKADLDRNGHLSPEEFLKVRGPAELARRDFRLFDRNSDDNLTLDEFSTIPTVLPPEQRGPLPDPMLALADSITSRLGISLGLGNWEERPERELNAEEFVQVLSQGFRFYDVRFHLAEADSDNNGKVQFAEARRFIEILLGVRRPDGTLLRLPNGQVVNYRIFIYADENRDDRLDRREFVERTYGGPDVGNEFEKVDIDRDGGISFDEWRQMRGRALLDPVIEFRQLDKNLDAKVDPAELVAGTPDWKKALPKHVFPAFDIDRDGTLSLAEYRMTPQANLILNWHSPPNDKDDNGTLSFGEFQFGREEFPLLRIVYFHRLDTNSNGQLQTGEFTFKTRMPTEFFSLSEDGAEWKSLFQFEQFRSCGSPAVSPDGKQLAFDAWSASQQNDSAIYVVNLEEGMPRRICSGMMPVWLPDGRKLVCSRSSPIYGVWLVDTEGDEFEHLASGWGAQISPDGKTVAFTEGAALKALDLASKEARTILAADTHPYRQIFWNSGWSPDSRRLCFKGLTADEKQEIATVNMTGDEPGLKVHFSGKDSINADFAWHPNGHRIVFPMTSVERGGLQLYEFDPDKDTAPTLVKGQDASLHNSGVCWTPDGQRMIVVGRAK